jgi:hypothetical protein
MKTVISLVFLFFSFVCAGNAQKSFTAFGSTVNYALPNPDQWMLVKNGMHKGSKKYLLMFEHKPIKDAKGRTIKPVMAVICEPVPESMDAIKYSIWKRGQTPFSVNKMLSFQDGDFTHRNAIGYDGEYEKIVKHRVLVAHMRDKAVGLQVICDSTDGVYDKVEEEMRSFLKSITFKD